MSLRRCLPFIVYYYKHWIQRAGIENHQAARKAWELRIKFWLLSTSEEV
ncbi:hypothetical protein [Nostoc sp. KVJ3]